MQPTKALEQRIAVFGESGSGKTVLLSSFYGAAQEPQYIKNSLFHIVADDVGDGSRLHRNYLGMRDSARLPEPTIFSSATHTFSVKLKDPPGDKKPKPGAIDALRLVWHDYPGEWFEQDVSGPEEAQRRVDTFRALLGSDVAFFLVDGQRLLDNAGEEERYLKSLFSNFRNGLLSLKGDLLTDGKPLVQFPRIWVIALSKADLWPQQDVFAFRDMVIEKAGDDVDELRRVIQGFVQGSGALSVGEDFMMLSSARFSPGKIELTERVGLELILPIAATLPLERHVRWAKAKQLPMALAEKLLGGGAQEALLALAVLGKSVKLPGPVGAIVTVVLASGVLEDGAKLAGDKLKSVNEEATVNHNYLTATLTRFRMDLEDAEAAHVLLRSRR